MWAGSSAYRSSPWTGWVQLEGGHSNYLSFLPPGCSFSLLNGPDVSVISWCARGCWQLVQAWRTCLGKHQCLRWKSGTWWPYHLFSFGSVENRDGMLSHFRCSSYGKFFMLRTSFVVLLWTRSRSFSSARLNGPYIRLLYSRWGLTSVLGSMGRISVSMLKKDRLISANVWLPFAEAASACFLDFSLDSK